MASLSEENIKSLYRCENKAERRNVLAKILNFASCDEDEDDMKTSILLDFHLESINFACEQGFSWQQGQAVFELMKDLLNSTLDLPLVQASDLFKTVIKSYAGTFQSHRVSSVIDFVFSFFFNHFHLYKFVFTNERDVDRRMNHLVVETPPHLPALGNATEKSEWECQQALKKLEEQRNKTRMEKQLQLESEIERLQSLVHDKLSLLNTDKPITAEDLNNIVEETVRIYVASAGSSIKHLIEENQEKLVYEFEKTAVGQNLERNMKPSCEKPLQSPSAGLSKKKATKGNKAGKG